MENCGDLTNNAWAIGHPCVTKPDGTCAYYVEDVRNDDRWAVEANCAPPPGTGTPGYWKNHPDAWPVEEITIGGVHYSKEAAIALLKTPEKGDKTYTLFRALVAARLNVPIGNPGECIAETIGAADEWMADYGPVGSGVKTGGKTSPWRDGEPLYQRLDEYNNGLLCAPPRD